jgi:hypothetical protein
MANLETCIFYWLLLIITFDNKNVCLNLLQGPGPQISLDRAPKFLKTALPMLLNYKQENNQNI